jgi:hypothetical protein
VKLEIIVHCWHYSRLLTYQLSSLIQHAPPFVETTVTICYCPTEDAATQRTVNWFYLAAEAIPHLAVNPLPMHRRHLLRRAIGRNIACKSTFADWVWLTDCDYVFHNGCLAALPQLLVVDGPLVYPRLVHKHKSHAIGDRYIEAAVEPAIHEINPDDFELVSHSRAIGGLQIVRGSVARTKGYLPHSVYQEPAESWQRTIEDPAFRKYLGTDGEPIELPALYRIRHTLKGREAPCEL